MKGESLRAICRDNDTPAIDTVFKWIHTIPSFAAQYARAREVQADVIADEMFEIADDGSNDFMLIKRGEEEVEVVNHEHISRSKLRVDQRKWWLARVAAKKYGDKIEVESNGTLDVKVTIGGNAE